MKNRILWCGAYIVLLAASATAQTNTFPTTGPVGIGTTSPAATLQVWNGNHVPGEVGLQVSLATGGGVDVTTALMNSMDDGNYIRFLHKASTWGAGDYIDANGVFNVKYSGNVGIGTTNPQYSLSVNGTIQAKEVLVNTGWADYVFQPDYRVRPLAEVAAFIKANHHLPDIPSETEIKDKGVSLGDMQTKLLAKIEELTLQMIQLDEKNRALAKKVAQLEGR